MKRALVTGASGVIGAAICRRLALEGHHVYVHAHTQIQQAQKVAKEITDAGGSAWSMRRSTGSFAERHCIITSSWRVGRRLRWWCDSGYSGFCAPSWR